MNKENFADKWVLYPQKKDSFYRWLYQAREDFINNPLKATGIDSVGELLKESLGEAPVNRALKSYADDVFDSRQKGKLYSAGLTAGLTTKPTSTATKVKGHTFFGK